MLPSPCTDMTGNLTRRNFLAAAAAAILMLVGLPIALWVAYSQRRWKFMVESVVALPLILPPTVLGFYLLVAFGAANPLGRWYMRFTGGTLAFTFTGLVIGSVLYSLPFAVHPMVAGFRSIDQKLIAAARTLGAQLVIREVFVDFVPVEKAKVHGTPRGCLALEFHETGGFAHCLTF